MDVETKDLGEGVHAIILKQGVFPFRGDRTRVLFARECTRKIADSIVECRKKKTTETAAIIGQPGIGKSYGLFYLAHRFLQEDDVEAVVLESSANGRFHFFFRKGYDQTVHSKDIGHGMLTESNAQLIDDEFLCNEKVIYIVDMADTKPPSILSRDVGFTVLSSSPRPFKKHVEKECYKKTRMVLYSPPWTKEAIKVVFDYASDFEGDDLGIKTWAQTVKKPFEFYFDLFGGTLRALHLPETEMELMAKGASKLWTTQPNKILNLIHMGVESVDEDFTHTLFCEQGGVEEESYIVKAVPTERQFRSSFTNFWFRTHIAPRILFQHYTVTSLNVLYHTCESADPGKRGVAFEDVFHKLLPLGKWDVMDFCAHKKVQGTTIDLKGVPVKKRTNDDYPVNISDWAGWGDDQTLGNKRDVCHLVDLWQRTENGASFYWVPHGKQFPGLDSVYKEGSSKLYFIQVKTGKAAQDVGSWIDKAVNISTLLYEKLGSPTINCTLLVGCEPQSAPKLGKRKHEELNKSYPELGKWDFQYIVAPCLPMQNQRNQFELNWEILSEMKTDFDSYWHLLSQEGEEST